jgi:hypothetical protein
MAETENSSTAATAEAVEIVEPTAAAEKEASAAASADAGAVNAETTEDISYQAVEKDGSVTAIWEMQGRKHLRTIDPRSAEGKQILALFETAG